MAVLRQHVFYFFTDLLEPGSYYNKEEVEITVGFYNDFCPKWGCQLHRQQKLLPRNLKSIRSIRSGFPTVATYGHKRTDGRHYSVKRPL